MQGNEIIFNFIIPFHFLFICIFLTGYHDVGEIHYCIGCRISKINIFILDLLFFPLILAILPVKAPCTITNIAVNTPLVNFLIMFHGDCYQIFHIQTRSFLGSPCRNLSHWNILWVPIRKKIIGFETPLVMPLIVAFSKNHIWLGSQPSTMVVFKNHFDIF